MEKLCRYCHKKISPSQPYVVLFKSTGKGKNKLEERAHLKCYTEQLFTYINNLTKESVKLIQEKGYVI